MSTKAMMKPLDGQEEIFKALANRDFLRLWDLCKFVGYQEINSPYVRMMIMRSVFDKFDPSINNNFITYYMTNLHYAGMAQSKQSSFFTKDKRAIKDFIEHSIWPTKENENPINQNSHILRNFSM